MFVGQPTWAFRARGKSEIPSCRLQVPLDKDPPKLELELHCDIVVIRPVIPRPFHPRLNRAFTSCTTRQRKANFAIA